MDNTRINVYKTLPPLVQPTHTKTQTFGLSCSLSRSHLNKPTQSSYLLQTTHTICSSSNSSCKKTQTQTRPNTLSQLLSHSRSMHLIYTSEYITQTHNQTYSPSHPLNNLTDNITGPAAAARSLGGDGCCRRKIRAERERLGRERVERGNYRRRSAVSGDVISDQRRSKRRKRRRWWIPVRLGSRSLVFLSLLLKMMMFLFGWWSTAVRPPE
ncbi:hypothetical protein Hdeb2414_s0002g00060531 [Helianthus debilis subsp. tardiflorus]